VNVGGVLHLQALSDVAIIDFGRTNPILLRLGSPIGANGTLKASEAAGVEFIDESR
jgi:hypothetical protein